MTPSPKHSSATSRDDPRAADGIWLYEAPLGWLLRHFQKYFDETKVRWYFLVLEKETAEEA